MTTPAPLTNPCSQCGQHEALFSLMSLGDFSQIKPCGTCAIMIFRGLADEMEQAGLAAETAETIAELTDPDGDIAAQAVPADATEPPPDMEPQQATPARTRKNKTDGT